MKLVLTDRASAVGGETIIPSLLYDPDALPTNPSPWDLEFELGRTRPGTVIDSGATGWTWDIGKTIPSCLTLTMASLPGGRTPGFYWPAPPAPFTMTAKIAALAWPGGPAIGDAGITLAEATPGKFIHGPLDCADANYLCTVGGYWTSPTTFSANFGTYTSGGSGSGSASRVSGYAYMLPYWARFVVHSTTNVDGWISWDGHLWTQWASAYNPGFTIGSFGVDPHLTNGAVAYDWVRFTTP